MKWWRGVVAALLFASSANAEERTIDTCAAAHLEAQKQRRDHRFVAAEASLVTCARDACPQLIRSDCTEWLIQVRAALPTIVVDVRARSGSSLLDAVVSVDGTRIPASEAGKAKAIDPGEHLIRVAAPGYRAVERRAVVREGAQAQAFVFDLEPEPAPAASTPPSRSFAVPIALGAVGVVGLGVFAGFGLGGLSVKSDLDAAGCRPGCDEAMVSRLRRDFAIADVSLIVSVVALGAGALVLLLPEPSPARQALAGGLRF